MKTVFQTNEVAHIWAQRNQSKGKGGNIFFEGNTIYSYGYHFPLATFITNKAGETKVLLNSDNYSVSTSKHKGYARQAVNHYTRLYAPTAIVKACTSTSDTKHKQLLAVAIEQTERKLVQQAQAATNRRTAKKKADEIALATDFYKTTEELLAFFGIKFPAKTVKLYETLIADYSKVVYAFTASQKREAAKRLKAQEAEKQARIEEAQEAIPLWLAGESLTMKQLGLVRYDLPHALLRVTGEEIETSQGARFPLSHAVKAWPLIHSLKEQGKEWHTNGHTLHLGSYSVDSIDAQGNVKAGCHYVKYESIERVAKQLNLA